MKTEFLNRYDCSTHKNFGEKIAELILLCSFLIFFGNTYAWDLYAVSEWKSSVKNWDGWLLNRYKHHSSGSIDRIFCVLRPPRTPASPAKPGVQILRPMSGRGQTHAENQGHYPHKQNNKSNKFNEIFSFPNSLHNVGFSEDCIRVEKEWYEESNLVSFSCPENTLPLG